MSSNISSGKLALLTILFAVAFPVVTKAETHNVTVGDNFFSDNTLTIAVGDTVRWTNATGGNLHDVTSTNSAWVASITASSFTFEVTFDEEGSFDYFCTVHPVQMTGTITVVAAASAELALNSVSAGDDPVAPGDMISIDSAIQNSGDGPSGAFTISYYASTNDTITTSDNFLGSAQIADISVDETLNHQAMVTVPLSVPAGEYFIGAILSFPDGNDDDNSNHDAQVVTFLGQFFINPGLNDAWVSADAPFQGFFFTVFQDLGFFFLSWFTFDSEPPGDGVSAVFGAADQRWVTGAGLYALDTVTLNVELTSGGIFNASDPPAEQQPGYGTITIVFISCNEATLTYDFPSVGLSGVMTLTRTLADNVPLCVTLNEELQIQFQGE